MNRPQFLLALAAASLANSLAAAPVATVFQVQQASSNLHITARQNDLVGSDVKPLSGTINVTFSFGSSGALPTTANLTLASANLQPVGAYSFTLGSPPSAGVNATASGLVANVVSTTPPSTMTKPAGSSTTYSFNSSQFTLTMIDGDISVSGTVNDFVDLATETPPFAGTSPAGTVGSLALTSVSVTGPYTRFNATLNLPMVIQRTLVFGPPSAPEPVDLTLNATVVATTSFYVALAPVPADFNQDDKTDQADYALWRAGFGKASGATLADGDANANGRTDGVDFLIWQRNRGTSPPALSTPVPEPNAAAGLMGLLAINHRLLRRLVGVPPQGCRLLRKR